MPRGDKSAYTDKQKRQARHIEKGYEKRGLSEDEAERRAWATVNKMTGGGKKSGSGVGKTGQQSAGAQGRPAGRQGRRGAAGRGTLGIGKEGRGDESAAAAARAGIGAVEPANAALLPPGDVVAARCLVACPGGHFCAIFHR